MLLSAPVLPEFYILNVNNIYICNIMMIIKINEGTIAVVALAIVPMTCTCPKSRDAKGSQVRRRVNWSHTKLGNPHSACA
jgi:hypothetical protein